MQKVLSRLYKARYIILMALAMVLILLLSAYLGKNAFFNQADDKTPPQDVAYADFEQLLDIAEVEDASEEPQTNGASTTANDTADSSKNHDNNAQSNRECAESVRVALYHEFQQEINNKNHDYSSLLQDIQGHTLREQSVVERYQKELEKINQDYQRRLSLAGCQ